MRRVYLKDGTLCQYQATTASNGITNCTTINLSDDSWHMLSEVISSASGTEIWIDGKRIMTGATTRSYQYLDASANGIFDIGNGSFSTSPNATFGTFDNVRIYSRALAPKEISQLYEERIAGYSAGCPASMDWKTLVWNNPNLVGEPSVCMSTSGPDIDWNTTSPATSIRSDLFSVSMTKDIAFSGGVYEFTIDADDGVRISLDDAMIANYWYSLPGHQRHSIRTTISEGIHRVRVDMFDAYDTANLHIHWTPSTYEHVSSGIPEW
jgi:hypothetical protein